MEGFLSRVQIRNPAELRELCARPLRGTPALRASVTHFPISSIGGFRGKMRLILTTGGADARFAWHMNLGDGGSVDVDAVWLPPRLVVWPQVQNVFAWQSSTGGVTRRRGTRTARTCTLEHFHK